MIVIGDLVELEGFPQMRGLVVNIGKTQAGKIEYATVYNGKSDIRHRFLFRDLRKVNKDT
jgi:hypothetical protein